MAFKMEFIAFKIDISSISKCIVDIDVDYTLRARAKMLLNLWTYDFYDTTLSTVKQLWFVKKILYPRSPLHCPLTIYETVEQKFHEPSSFGVWTRLNSSNERAMISSEMEFV